MSTKRTADPALLDPRWWPFDYGIERIIERHRLPIRRFETRRTEERQKFLYDHGRSKTLLSKHLRNLATDFVPFVDGKWIWDKNWMIVLGYLVMQIHMKGRPIRWGGDWDRDSQFWDERFFDGAHYELVG